MILKLKYTLSVVYIMLLASTQAYCFNHSSDTIKCKPFIDSVSMTEYYMVVDSMPEYPGGEAEMHRFFTNNFRYPPDNDACCKVIVEFIIDQSGFMKDLKIKKGLEAYFDNETLRVMRLMPRWKPGKCNGIPVSVKFFIPWNVLFYNIIYF